MKNKYFFGWENIKKIIKDLYQTFSNNKSFLSSKRIERFAFTAVALGIVIGSFVYLVKSDKLTATDSIILITPLLVAAGHNMIQTEKGKKNDSEI